MELSASTPLAQSIDDFGDALDLVDRIDLIRTLGSGLQCAHDKGVDPTHLPAARWILVPHRVRMRRRCWDGAPLALPAPGVSSLTGSLTTASKGSLGSRQRASGQGPTPA